MRRFAYSTRSSKACSKSTRLHLSNLCLPYFVWRYIDAKHTSIVSLVPLLVDPSSSHIALLLATVHPPVKVSHRRLVEVVAVVLVQPRGVFGGQVAVEYLALAERAPVREPEAVEPGL